MKVTCILLPRDGLYTEPVYKPSFV